MISRATARLISELIAKALSKGCSNGYRRWIGSDSAATYNFLFDNDFPAWLCNAAKDSCSSSTTRTLTEFLMKIHTGESLARATQQWTWLARRRLGQQYLRQLAEVLLAPGTSRDLSGQFIQPMVEACKRRLELDGYQFRGSTLLAPEEDALDASEASGVLEGLYKDLGLEEAETTVHHLRLSEEHYVAGRWDDAISNSRKYLECVLREVASARAKSIPSSASVTADRPVKVREYLETAGLLEKKEKETIASIYGLLSETGGHPYMAKNDQARLLRHLALTIAQFVMLRLKGSRDIPRSCA